MTVKRVIRRPELLAMIGISRSTLYAWMAESYFPRPLLIGKRLVGWDAETVTAWLNQRVLSSGG